MSLIKAFDTFSLWFDDVGTVRTAYPTGNNSTVKVNNDHAYHAGFLGTTPAITNLLHELTHHILAIAQGFDSCPIIYASAHGERLPHDAQEREWMITALSYFALGKPFRPAHEHEWKALAKVAQVCCPYELRNEIITIFNQRNGTIKTGLHL